ncbi:MAG: SRPBCC family protein [Actinomycetia bacterium]|nr:SRPBCC family protein [Actinomycetes bacterium]MCP4226908.1 SRPBCC family protein [Actinomycetes bacterium]MCP5031316.1 SRPBCC family protein [Actinomycetes bacterium]
MPAHARVQRTVNAPKEVVWEILDDFPGIANWSAGIQKSFTTGDASKVTGLGAERRCELGGEKLLDERISAYTEGQSMTVDVWNVEGLPLKSSLTTFSVRAVDDDSTEVTVAAEAVPKMPGFLAGLLSPMASRFMAKNFSGLLDELATEAESQQKA